MTLNRDQFQDWFTAKPEVSDEQTKNDFDMTDDELAAHKAWRERQAAGWDEPYPGRK